MAWIEYNPNPRRNRVGDCAIRAIAKATDQDWEMAYTGLYVKGYSMGDLPSANSVWGAYAESIRVECLSLLLRVMSWQWLTVIILIRGNPAMSLYFITGIRRNNNGFRQ